MRSLRCLRTRPAAASIAARFCAAPGLAAGGLAALGALPLGGVRKAEAAGTAPSAGAYPQEHLHALLGRLHGHRRSRERRVGRPGARLGIARSTAARIAPRAPRRASSCHGDRRLHYPMKLVNGQWTADLMGSGHQRDRRQAAADSREVGPGFGLLARLRQIHQRRRVSQSQVRRLLGHQQLRPPGAHLPFDDGRRRSQYLGLRRDDQQLHRHPQHQDAVLPRRQSGRSASGLVAASARRQGAQPGELHRRRPAPHPHRRACHRICAACARAPTFRCCGACCGTSSRTAGRTRSSSSSASTAWTTSARKSRSGRRKRSSASSGVPGEQLKRVAEMFAKDKPSTPDLGMGQTQHTVGTANVRASCILLLATGNVGAPGTGANIFRGHTNVQGATDLGLDIVTLPLYYGLAEGAWKHWCRVWEVDYDWMQSRASHDQEDHGDAGHPFDALVRCDAAAEGPGRAERQPQGDVRHGPRRQHRHPHAGSGRRASRSSTCSSSPIRIPPPGRCSSRAQGRHVPAAGRHQLRDATGSRTASNRAIQWGEQIVKPIFESKDDNEVMYLLAKKLGFADQMFKNIKVENNLPSAEDLLREINRGGWSTGYCGQSPERLKLHMANQKDFDMRTQKATTRSGARAIITACPGRAGGRRSSSIRARRCSTTPPSRSRRAAARSAPASASSARKSCPTARPARSACWRTATTRRTPRSRTAIRSSRYGVLKKLGWDKDLTDGRTGDDPEDQSQPTPTASRGRPTFPAASSASPSRTAASPTATARRAPMPGTCPTRSRSTASRSTRRAPNSSPNTRRCPTRKQFRVPNVGFDVQKAAVEKGIAKRVPAHPLVRPAGRVRRRRRGDPLQQVARRTAAGHVHRDQSGRRRRARHQGRRRGSGLPAPRTTRSAKVKALVTERVGKGVTWCPFHFARLVPGRRSARQAIRKAADPIVLGESVNTLTTYGYDPVTGMQEPKATLCQIRAA